MATGPPPTTNGPVNPDTGPQPSPTDLNWDGDRMFNIYIIDYCQKRGFSKTAQQLADEADIPVDSQPPINAKQGLLFEWWSVFWVLFTAKSSGNGTDDAMLYTQHQQQLRAAQKPIQAATTQVAIKHTTPRGIGPGSINGPPTGAHLTGPHQLTNGTSVQLPYAGQQHVNGAPSQTNGPTIGTPAVPTVPRTAPPQQQPQRPPNGTYQRSPTMASSPQTQGGPQQPGSMPQLRTMMPPNGLQGRPVNAMPGAPHHTPQPSYQQISGATPSHPNSPAQHGTVAGSSPSFAPQPPNSGGSITDINTEFWNIDASKLNDLKVQVGVPSKEIPSLTIEEKTKMITIARQRGWLKSSQGGPMNPAAGPSNHAVPRPPQQHTPQTQARSAKRSSTSPGGEGPNTDTSPPANKRIRRSPTGTEPPPPMAPMVPAYSQQQQQQQQQQQPGTPAAQHHGIPNGGMPRTMGMPPMGPFPAGNMPHMVGPQMMQMSPHVHPGGPHAMSPALVNQHPPGMNMAQFQYRQTMQAAHKSGAMTNMMPGSQGSPGSSDGQFGNNDASGSRPGTGQFVPGMQGPMPPGMHMQSQMQGQMPPGMGPRGPMQTKQGGGMMPPPSPAMKNNATQNKDGADPATNSSPRNAAMNAGPGSQGQPPAPGGTPHMNGNTAPPTPGSAAAHTPGAGPSNLTVPSPPVMNGGPQQGPPQLTQGDQLGDNVFGNPDLFTGLGFGEDLPNFDFESSFNFDLGGSTSWS